ncbi:MAG: aminomethyl-transferring glycine dehydrogenase subunit GcvPB [Sedimentisphaerales bacterium]|nr:aminomethyl-transferring glycine dehydrogenase subunit GcvPB [Sedimentisphaerales bacterium]
MVGERVVKLLFEKSVPGRRAVRTDLSDVPRLKVKKSLLRKKPARLPELSELDVVRHFTELSRRNFGVDSNFYPLGSCTMKYNPKVNELIASYPGFADLHPLMPQLQMGGMLTQGALRILHEMDMLLREITGMAGFTMQPLAGAHGELTGMMIIAAYHRKRGNKKTTLLIPDSAHGTNPASAAIAGYGVVAVPSNKDGVMDVDAVKEHLNDEVAGLMLTCPNTLGLFNPHVKEICDLIHSVDGLAYYDGANLNAIVGKARPGDFGFDIVHINLHKTFATPHGGGGPGAGPVGVKEKLVPFLPVSIVVKRDDGTYVLEYDRPESIGYIAPFYGNFGVVLRAYVYTLMLGKEGLRRVAENAVLNANYIKEKLKGHYKIAVDKLCKHECVFSTPDQMAQNGIHAIDVAKALIDRSFHPPTVYFPAIVKEAMMIEPTETESKETLDAFINAMIEIARQAETVPDELKSTPKTAVVCRPNETLAAKSLNIASV